MVSVRICAIFCGCHGQKFVCVNVRMFTGMVMCEVSLYIDFYIAFVKNHSYLAIVLFSLFYLQLAIYCRKSKTFIDSFVCACADGHVSVAVY